MSVDSSTPVAFGRTLGIGLLIGVGRERHKQARTHPAALIRTTALFAMLGAIGATEHIAA